MDKYVAFITIKTGGAFVRTEIFANNQIQARAMISALPYFKSFAKLPIKDK